MVPPCRQLEHAPTSDAARWVGRARAVKTAALNFFVDDPLFSGRLRAAIARLPDSEYKAIHHWAKHHLRS
jgi:hypothetical protein